MSDAHITLAAERLTYAYRIGTPTVALDDVSLALGRDEFVCLIGPSGCGKSTLLRVLSGLITPAQGRVTLDGLPINGPHPRVRLVFQQANLMPWRSVVVNIALPLELAGMGRAEREAAAREIIGLMGLSGFEAALPDDLSGGMAQRVAIGRALVEQPEVLLLDEPFGSLDALTRDLLGEELLRIWQARHGTVLMVTHSIPEAILLADRVLVMSPRPGRIEAAFPVDLARPRSLEGVHSPEAGRLAHAIRQALRSGAEPSR